MRTAPLPLHRRHLAQHLGPHLLDVRLGRAPVIALQRAALHARPVKLQDVDRVADAHLARQPPRFGHRRRSAQHRLGILDQQRLDVEIAAPHCGSPRFRKRRLPPPPRVERGRREARRRRRAADVGALLERGQEQSLLRRRPAPRPRPHHARPPVARRPHDLVPRQRRRLAAHEPSAPLGQRRRPLRGKVSIPLSRLIGGGPVDPGGRRRALHAPAPRQRGEKPRPPRRFLFRHVRPTAKGPAQPAKVARPTCSIMCA